MQGYKRAVGAAIAAGTVLAIGSVAQAAPSITYVVKASGSGISAGYVDVSANTTYFNILQGTTLTFTIPLSSISEAYGMVDASPFILNLTDRGLLFSFDNSGDIYRGLVSGGGSACFDNPDGTFPTSGIMLKAATGCGSVSYRQQGHYDYSEFAGTITSITASVGDSPYDYAFANIIGYVPEPATWSMMLVGFGLMGGALRYRRRSTKVVYG